jgi:LacI family transcriptional regulator
LACETRLLSDRCLVPANAFYEASLLLAGPQRPTAVIAGGMGLLPGVLRAARAAGLAIARDLSVVAGCDSELAELCSPAVTAVAWDIESQGRIAAQMLLAAMRDPATGQQERVVTMPTRLVVRESCTPPA